MKVTIMENVYKLCRTNHRLLDVLVMVSSIFKLLMCLVVSRRVVSGSGLLVARITCWMSFLVVFLVSSQKSPSVANIQDFQNRKVDFGWRRWFRGLSGLLEFSITCVTVLSLVVIYAPNDSTFPERVGYLGNILVFNILKFFLFVRQSSRSKYFVVVVIAAHVVGFSCMTLFPITSVASSHLWNIIIVYVFFQTILDFSIHYLEYNHEKESVKSVFDQLLQTSGLQKKLAVKYSHFIRSGINGLSPFIEGKEITEIFEKESVELLRECTMQTISTTENLMDYLSMRNNRFMLKPSSTNLRSCIQRAISVERSGKKSKNVQIVTDIQMLPVSVFIDENQFYKLISNLLSNAFKFCRSGTITIHASFFETQFYFYVRDTGMGISKENLKNIFVPFAVKDNKERCTIGLGLSYCKEIVKMMLGGSLKIESELGKGTKVMLKLKLKSELRTLRRRSIVMTPPPRTKKRYIRVLVVDDNVVNRKVLKRKLEEMGFSNVVTASDGMRCLKKLKISKFDIVFLDINMPNLNGYATAKEIRSHMCYDKMQIYSYSASSINQNVLSVNNFDGHFPKPIRDELLETIMTKVRDGNRRRKSMFEQESQKSPFKFRRRGSFSSLQLTTTKTKKVVKRIHIFSELVCALVTLIFVLFLTLRYFNIDNIVAIMIMLLRFALVYPTKRGLWSEAQENFVCHVVVVPLLAITQGLQYCPGCIFFIDQVFLFPESSLGMVILLLVHVGLFLYSFLVEPLVGAPIGNVLLVVLFIGLSIVDGNTFSKRMSAIKEKLREKRAKLEEENNFIESFTSKLSHDLRTPINFIFNQLGELSEEKIRQFGEVGEILLISAIRIKSVLDDFVDFVKFWRGNVNILSRDVFDVHKAVNGVVDFHTKVRFDSKRITTEIKIDRNQFVTFDQKKLQRVIGMAILNSLENCRSRVQVFAKFSKGKFFFSVRDDGDIFTSRDERIIANPFKSEEEFKTISNISLNVLMKFVGLLGGKIRCGCTVDNERFIGISFELDETAAPVVREARDFDRREDGHSLGPERKKILFVEDSSVYLKMYRMWMGKLEYIENVDFFVAVNGKQGLQVIRDSGVQFDFVFTDFLMPEMNGRDMVKSIREEGLGREGMKIFMLSGKYDTEGDGIPVIEKPIKFSKIVSIIRKG